MLKNTLFHQVDFINNTDSSDVYKQSKIHVMPTITTSDSIEGFGISNVEAASFGLPLIVSSSGGRQSQLNKMVMLSMKMILMNYRIRFY